MAAIAVVVDQTTAGALYDPKDPFNEAVAAFYIQASGGLGDVYAPVLSLTAGDNERPGLLGYIKGLRLIHIEAFDTDAAVTATELLRFGDSWAAVHAIHAARPSAAHPTGRYLLTLAPKVYAGTGVQLPSAAPTAEDGRLRLPCRRDRRFHTPPGPPHPRRLGPAAPRAAPLPGLARGTAYGSTSLPQPVGAWPVRLGAAAGRELDDLCAPNISRTHRVQ
ncbi:hypothetical protein GCM10010129_74150 [Streptomyces fumigatiscleroticus]|nr:hypothetical protein GCM10010129_74150 [Streptomyces fumigatiscleroticus]